MDVNSFLARGVPVVGSRTVVLKIAANAAPGTAEALMAALQTLYATYDATAPWSQIRGLLSGVLLGNCSGATMYLRGTEVGAADTGVGIPFADLDRVFLSIHDDPVDGLLLENAGPVAAMLIFNEG